MKIEFICPKSEVLQKYIEFFSFIENPNDVETDLLVFPNVISILSLSPNTELEIRGNTVTIKTNPAISGIQSDICGRILVPLHFRYLGKCNEVCITFKPLGLEHFFAQSFAEISPENYQTFKPDFADWDEFCERLFKLPAIEKQMDLLEKYFLQKLRNPRLEEFEVVVNRLLDIEENTSIREISEQTGIHQKRLERLCQKHLGCSAATFRRIARFRYSVNLQLTENNVLNLTETSHQSNFFDQSYFAKEFRRLSEMTPKQFFCSTWKLPEYGIVWKLR